MRIIAGEYRSRRLETLPGLTTRPTPDRLRESLFSILQPRLPGCRFVDAYAGSGAVGLEALSRGATHVVLIENHRAAFAMLEQNVCALQAQQRVTLVRAKVAGTLAAHLPADIVFADPPYEERREYDTILMALAATPPSLALVQHDARRTLPEETGLLRRVRVLRQGDNCVSFYEAAAP